MPDIKTKDVVKGTIKKIDKAAVASQRMKQAYISTKDKAEHSVQPAESSETEYASNKVENTADVVVHETAHRADKVGRWGVRETRKNVVEAKDNIQQFKQKRAAQRVERQAATRSGRIATHGQGTIRTLEHGEKTIKQSASSAGKKTIKQTAKGTAKTTQRAVKTAEQTAKTTIKTTKQAAKAAQKTGKSDCGYNQSCCESNCCGSQGNYSRSQSFGGCYRCRGLGSCGSYPCDLSDWYDCRLCVWHFLFR